MVRIGRHRKRRIAESREEEPELDIVGLGPTTGLRYYLHELGERGIEACPACHQIVDELMVDGS